MTRPNRHPKTHPFSSFDVVLNITPTRADYLGAGVPMKFSGSFGSWLKQRRKALDLTQNELAEQVGCAAITIQKFERDIARPSKAMTERLADVLVIADEDHAGFVAFARHKSADLPAAAETMPQLPTPRTNLPAQPIPFVGRSSELAALAAQLAQPDCRLLTLVGEGGIGKTRLALQTANALSAQFADGVYFVSLAPLSDPELIVPTIAEAVGFQFYPGGAPKQQLLDFLRDKSLLVVVDNFEHLLAGAPLVSEILQAAPRVQVIATSRERLNLQEETLYRVLGMELPDANGLEDAAECDAVKLFVQSARRVQPWLALTSERMSAVARICRQVEGMPLGILLAAAWVDNLSLAEIGDEIARSFDFLETETRNVPARQRSLRAVFDHSWQMLSAGEQAVFSQLSVFRGGFTREAAQAVTGASLKMLAALVNKSFIRRDASGRYDIHELLRQYAEAKLSETPGALAAAQDQHCAYFADLMEYQTPRLKNADEKDALMLIEIEFDNIRTGWDYALAAEQFDAIGQSAEALALFCYIKSVYAAECEQLLQKAIDGVRACAIKSQLRVLLGNLLAMLAYYCGANIHPEAATTAFREADELLRAHGTDYEWAMGHLWWAMVRSSHWPSWVRLTGPDWHVLRERQQQDLLIYETSGDYWRVAIAQATLASIEYNLHDFLAAQAFAQQSLALFQSLGTRFWQTLPFWKLGLTVRAEKDYSAANSYLRQAITLFQEFGDDSQTANLLRHLGDHCAKLGEYAEAKTHLALSLAIYQRLGDRYRMAWTLEFSSSAARLQRLYTEAYGYNQQALGLFRQIGRPFDVANQLNEMAAGAIGQGLYGLAEQHCRESLTTLTHARQLFWIEPLLHFGYLTAWAGNPSESIGILIIALRSLDDIYRAGDLTHTAYEEMQTFGEKYLAEVCAKLSPDELAAAQEHAKSLDLERVVAEILASPPLFPSEPS